MALRSYFIPLRFVALFSPPDSKRLQRIGEECTFTTKFHLGNFKKVTETILIIRMQSRYLKSGLMKKSFDILPLFLAVQKFRFGNTGFLEQT